MKIPSEIITGLFTLLGTLLGACATIGATWIRERNQNIRERDELIFNLAKVYWQEALIAARESKKRSVVPPLETFVISIKYFVNQIDIKKIDDKTLKKFLNDYSRVMDIVDEHFKKKG